MKNVYLFTILLTLSLLLTFLIKTYVMIDDVFYNSLGEQLSLERIEKILESKQKTNLSSYIFQSVFLILKILTISLILLTGVFFFNDKSSFNSIVGIVIKAEFIFLFPPLITLVWFGFLQSTYTFSDIDNLAPFSLLNITGSEVEVWMRYPLKVINAFEIVYIILLAYGLSQHTGTGFSRSLENVLRSYGLALLLWVTFVVFLIVNFNV